MHAVSYFVVQVRCDKLAERISIIPINLIHLMLFRVSILPMRAVLVIRVDVYFRVPLLYLQIHDPMISAVLNKWNHVF